MRFKDRADAGRRPVASVEVTSMSSRYFPWFLVFALGVLMAAFIFLLLVADPGARIPSP